MHARLEQKLRRELYGGSDRANKDGIQLFVTEESFNWLVNRTLPWAETNSSKSQAEKLKSMAARWWKLFGNDYKKTHPELIK